jgi:GT2 family glycosyltransferase
MSGSSLAVVMTCHNRRDKTLACLRRLFDQSDLPEGLSIAVYLTDDGSSDGTSEAVRSAYPDVCVLKGDGNLFWNRGMRAAWDDALKGDYDFYLWLNDDTLLYPSAVKALLDTHRALGANGNDVNIVAGSTQDGDTGVLTYGGVVQSSRWHPLKLNLVEPSSSLPLPCDTVNGNCVLIPRSVVQRVGNMDPFFTHGMGDYDYAFRARAEGCAVWVAPGFVGTCSRNSLKNSWMDGELRLLQRLKKLNQPKGLPLREWRVFTMRHTGILWPLFWLMPYGRTIISSLMAWPRRGAL